MKKRTPYPFAEMCRLCKIDKAGEEKFQGLLDENKCIGCGICVDACPQEVLEVVGGVAEVVNEDACIACGDCVEECPMGAIPEIVEE